MKFVEEIQKLPEKKRKTIFWLIVIIVGSGLLFCWVRITQIRIKSFEPKKFGEELRFPQFEEELKELQKFEMPEISDEELKELEETIKEEQE